MDCPAALLERISPTLRTQILESPEKMEELVTAELARLEKLQRENRRKAYKKYGGPKKKLEEKITKAATEVRKSEGGKSVWIGLASEEERAADERDPETYDSSNDDGWFDTLGKQADFIEENLVRLENISEKGKEHVLALQDKLEQINDIRNGDLVDIEGSPKEQLEKLKREVKRTIDRYYPKVVAAVQEENTRDEYVREVLSDLNTVFKADEAQAVKEAIQILSNSIPQTTAQTKARDQLVSDLINEAKDTKNYTAFTIKALGQMVDYFNKYATKDDYGVDSEALYLANRIEKSYWENLRREKGYTEALSGMYTSRFSPESLMDALQVRAKRPRSLLGLLPRMIDFLRHTSLVKRLLPPSREGGKGVAWTDSLAQGTKEFVEFHDRFDKILHDEILPSMELEESKKEKRGLYRKDGMFIPQDFSKAPLLYLRDPETGRLPENVVTALAAEALTWATTQGGATVYLDDKTIMGILGHENEYDASAAAKKAVRDSGVPRGRIMSQVGRNSIKHLNLQTHELSTADGYFEDRLANSLGLVAIEAMDKLGYVHSTPIEGHLFAHYKKPYKIWRKGTPEQRAIPKKGSVSEPDYIGLRVDTKINPETKLPIVSDAITALQEMQQRIGKLLKQLFDVEEGSNLPSTDPEDAEHVRKGIPKSLMEVDKTTEENIKSIQRNAIDYDTRVQDILMKGFKSDSVAFNKEIMEYKELDEVHVTDADSQEGKNLGIQREWDSLLEAYGKGSPTQYLMYALQRNMRLRVDSTGVNYHSGKGLHRIALVDKRTEVTLDPDVLSTLDGDDFSNLAPELQNYFKAVAFAMDLKGGTTRQGVDKAVLDQHFYADIYKKMTEPGPIRDGIEVFKQWDGTSAFTSEQQKAIGAASKEGGQRGWSMTMLDSWASMEKAKESGTSFTHRMPVEVDGLTNGLAIVLLQLPGADTPENWAKLKSVGLFPEGNEKSFGEYLKNNPGAKDNYQLLSERVQQTIDSVITTGDESMFGEFYNEKAYGYDVPSGTVQELAKAMAGLHVAVGMDPEKHPEYFMDAELSRNFSKDSLMQLGVYGAGAAAIRALIGIKGHSPYDISPESRFTDRIMKIASDTGKDADTRAGLIQASIQLLADSIKPLQNGAERNWKFTQDMSATMEVPSIEDIKTQFKPTKNGDAVFEFARNYAIPTKPLKRGEASPLNALESRAGWTYGEASGQNAKQLLSYQKDTREHIQVTAEYLAKAYEVMYNKRVQDFVALNDKPPTLKQQKEIQQKLIDDGWGANIKHVNSKDGDYRTYLEIIADEDVDMHQRHMEEGDTELAELAKSQIGVRSGSSNGKDSISANIRRTVPNADNTGVGTFVRLIHSIDAAIMGEVFANHNVMHVFDAYIAGTADIHDVTVAANKAFLEVNKDYDLLEVVKERKEEITKLIDETGELSDEQKNEIKGFPFEKLMLSREAFPDWDSWQEAFEADFKLNKEHRDDTLSKIQYANQFSLDNSHYEAESFEEQLLAEFTSSDKIFRSSSEKPQYERDFEKLFDIPLQADTAHRVIEQLKKYENNPPDSQHQAQLDQLMGLVILPGLKHVDDIIQFNVTKNPDGTVNTGEFQGNKIYMEAAGNRLTGIRLGLQETGIHEMSHAILAPYIENDTEGRAELQNLFDRAEKEIEPKDFLEEGVTWETASEADKAIARQRHEYIFNNPDGNRLDEFAAIGLTNKQFATALSRLHYSPKEELTEKLKDWQIWKTDPLRQLWNIFERALAWIAGNKYQTKNQDVHSALLNLAKNMVLINNQEVASLSERVDKKWREQEARINEGPKDWAKSTWFNRALRKQGIKAKVAGEKAREYWERTVTDKYKDQEEIIGYPGGTYTGAVKKARSFMKESWNDMGFPDLDFARNVSREVTGMKKEDLKRWRNLRRIASNIIDVFRKRTSERVKGMVEKAFGRKITKQEWKALNDVLLRTDFSSLLDVYTIPQVIGFLQNPASLRTEIKTIRDNLKQEYGRNGNAYAHQAQNLGQMITTGQVYSGVAMPQTNAHNIAQLYMFDERSREPRGNLEAAEQMIDTLATLHALELTDTNYKQQVSGIFQEEAARGDWNGVTNMLAMHEAYKQEALERNFEGNKVHVRKGYTHENFDSNVKLDYKPDTKEWRAEMLRRGYRFHSVVGRDPRHSAVVSDKTPVAIYVNDMGLGTYRGQITSLTNERMAGSDLISGLEETMGSAGTVVGRERVERMSMMAYKDARNQYNDQIDLGSPTQSVMVPVLSSDTKQGGVPVNFRYMMSDKNKQELLKRDDQAHDDLGMMYGRIYDKVNTKKINREVIKNLHEEWLALRGDKTVKMRYIGLDAEKQSEIDAYRMLPEDMRHFAKQHFSRNGIYVREDMYNYIMGFREVSVANTLHNLQMKGKLPVKLPLNLLKSIHIAEEVWKEVVQFARVKTSVLVPDVVIGNIYSNNLVLLADGIPPNYIVKKSKEALISGRKYQKDRNKMENLENEAMAREQRGQNVTALRAKVANLRRDLETNPVHQMIQEGLFQSIVEDTNAEAFKGRNAQHIQKGVQWVGEKISTNIGIGESVTTAAKEIMMTPDSKTFSTIMVANQYGDFVARYVKFKYDTEVRKIDKQTAIDESLDYFVYYDEPSDPRIEAANQYGVFMFWKFYARIQRVAFRLLAKKPATATMATIADNMMMNDFVDNYAGNVVKAWNRVDIVPVDRAFEAVGIPAADWAKLIIPGI